MDDSTGGRSALATTARDVAQRLLTIGENRLALLLVEVQEERARLLHVLVLALAMAVAGLLACMALTAAIAVALWEVSPVGVLAGLGCIYAAGAALAAWRLGCFMRDWHAMSATVDQLRKDHACIAGLLA